MYQARDLTNGTILQFINSVNVLPCSFQKYGVEYIADNPAANKTCEFSCLVFGCGARKTILLNVYGAGDGVYIRTAFSSDWYTEWVKL